MRHERFDRPAGIAALLAGLLFWLLTGCASPVRQGKSLPDTARLAEELNALAGGKAPAEARRLAEVAVEQSARLAAEYRSVRPAWLHNFLVNRGWRKRGLCYQWAEDLRAALVELEVRRYRLRWGVARAQTMREHNAVVITAVDQPFAGGLVLDPWRKSGQLIWVPVRQDKYPWEEYHPQEEPGS